MSDEARREWIAERLLDQDDEAAWRAQRNHCGVTAEQMIAAWAAERAEVEERSELERVAERALTHQWWLDLYGAA
jgi:hypothetical protein